MQITQGQGFPFENLEKEKYQWELLSLPFESDVEVGTRGAVAIRQLRVRR